MKKTLRLAVLAAGLAACGAARAEDVCSVPMANWHPREAVLRKALAQGWTVRRIKTDDGCYEVRGSDAQGRAIEVKVDPGTLAIVRLEYEDDDGEDDGEKHTKHRSPAQSGASSNRSPDMLDD